MGKLKMPPKAPETIKDWEAAELQQRLLAQLPHPSAQEIAYAKWLRGNRTERSWAELDFFERAQWAEFYFDRETQDLYWEVDEEMQDNMQTHWSVFCKPKGPGEKNYVSPYKKKDETKLYSLEERMRVDDRKYVSPYGVAQQSVNPEVGGYKLSYGVGEPVAMGTGLQRPVMPNANEVLIPYRGSGYFGAMSGSQRPMQEHSRNYTSPYAANSQNQYKKLAGAVTTAMEKQTQINLKNYVSPYESTSFGRYQSLSTGGGPAGMQKASMPKHDEKTAARKQSRNDDLGGYLTPYFVTEDSDEEEIGGLAEIQGQQERPNFQNPQSRGQRTLSANPPWAATRALEPIAPDSFYRRPVAARALAQTSASLAPATDSFYRRPVAARALAQTSTSLAPATATANPLLSRTVTPNHFTSSVLTQGPQQLPNTTPFHRTEAPSHWNVYNNQFNSNWGQWNIEDGKNHRK